MSTISVALDQESERGSIRPLGTVRVEDSRRRCSVLVCMSKIVLDCPKLRGYGLLVVKLIAAIRDGNNSEIAALGQIIHDRAEHNLHNAKHHSPSETNNLEHLV